MPQEVSAGMTNGKEITRPKNTSFSISMLYLQTITMAIHKYSENGGRDRFLPRQVGIPD